MEPIVGAGNYTYRVREDWAHPPAGLEVRACAVSVDSQDRVYCFNRNIEHPVVVFDRDGRAAECTAKGSAAKASTRKKRRPPIGHRQGGEAIRRGWRYDQSAGRELPTNDQAVFGRGGNPEEEVSGGGAPGG